MDFIGNPRISKVAYMWFMLSFKRKHVIQKDEHACTRVIMISDVGNIGTQVK